MKIGSRIAATRKETLLLLGIRASSLPRLEQAAGLKPRPGRPGYTPAELQKLVAELRRLLGKGD